MNAKSEKRRHSTSTRHITVMGPSLCKAELSCLRNLEKEKVSGLWKGIVGTPESFDPNDEAVNAWRENIKCNRWIEIYGKERLSWGRYRDLMESMDSGGRFSRVQQACLWRPYNQHFRKRTAASGNRKWSQIDGDLYTQCFTGYTKEVYIALYSLWLHQTPLPPIPS